jgi:hypothetical protein
VSRKSTSWKPKSKKTKSFPLSKQNPEPANNDQEAQNIPWPELPTSLSRGKTIKDESLSNFISFTFVTVVLPEILVPKI